MLKNHQSETTRLYGADYYAGDDCSSLLRRAQTTGSGYWWSRYNACVGYY
jgi:hypothetical protein